MATDSEHISADEANVLLLAMCRLDNFIDSGARPWIIYDGGEEDLKTTRAGYMSLIGAVRGKLSRIGFDSGDFPKVIFASMIGGAEYCAACHKPLIGD